MMKAVLFALVPLAAATQYRTAATLANVDTPVWAPGDANPGANCGGATPGVCNDVENDPSGRNVGYKCWKCWSNNGGMCGGGVTVNYYCAVNCDGSGRPGGNANCLQSTVAPVLNAGVEDLIDNNSPSDSTPEESSPSPSTPAGPSSQVQMTISGNAADYNAAYFRTDFLPKVKTATKSTLPNDFLPNVDLVLNNFYDGSVIVLFSVYGGDSATLQAFAAEIVRQANDPTSPLRGVLNLVQGASLVTTPVVPVPSGGDDGLSDGAIAGIVIGCVVFVVVIVLLLWCLACKNEEPQGQPPPDAPYGGKGDEEMQQPVEEEELENECELENETPKASADEEV